MRLGWMLACGAVAVGCHRRTAPPPDMRTACERALGTWQGDDVQVESARAAPSEQEVARRLVRAQQWRVTETEFETVEETHTTHEALRVVHDDRAHCTLEVTLGDAHRQLDLETLPDGRLRIGAPGGHVSVIVRRTP